MIRGIYSATTALLHNEKKMDTISNNLANTNTTGFKKDLVLAESFPETLLSKINGTNKPVLEGNSEGVKVQKEGNTYTLSTDEGYIRLKTPAGIGHSKSARFMVSKDGYLKTFQNGHSDTINSQGGNYILGKNGPIKVDNPDIEIDQQGNVKVGGNIIDNLVMSTPRHVIGTSSAGIRSSKIYTNFSEGVLNETSNKLDFALKGDGFFKVTDGENTFYTRDGSFTLNQRGDLITTEGHAVLGQYGPMYVDENNITINEHGELLEKGEIIDRFDIVNLTNKEDLRKQGNNLYTLSGDVQPQEEAFNGQVLQGYVEGSNVNPIKEMIKMVSLMRNYETNQKLITAHDEMLGKAVNEVGKV